jgi:uncharacterized membrane protein
MNSLANSPVAEPLDLRLFLPCTSSLFSEETSRPLFHLDENVSHHTAVSVSVAAPLAKVYERWLQYPGFPHFMRGSGGEDPEDNGRITWRIMLHGVKSAWEAEVCEEIPGERIAWKNINGRPARNSGHVCFRAISADRTQVTLAIEFQFSGVTPEVPDPLAALASRLERSLMSFAEFARAAEN